jgi:serine/threonine protein kinase
MVPRLTFHEEIGRGARSVVYRATYGSQTFALKVYHGPLDLEEATRQYRREAAIHAGLQHATIPSIYEVGVWQEKPYILSEHIRGRTLADALLERPFTEDEALRLGVEVAEALGEIHKRGLIHWDVKPRNIILADSGGARLIDFGLVGHQNEATSEGQAVGTFRYSAPEQTGMLVRPVDGRADLYALGAVLFECLVGRPPFVSNDLHTLLSMHAARKAPRIEELREGISPSFCDLVARLLSKDPDDRPGSGEAVAEALGRVQALPSDLEEPFLGLPWETFEALGQRLDAIYHCGARVNHLLPYEALHSANVLGTQEVLRLAASGKPKPVHHVSTVGVLPMTTSELERFAESSSLDAGSDPFFGGYAQSKWAAERLIEQARSQRLNVCVYRPAAIVGGTQSALSPTTDLIWRLVRLALELGAAPPLARGMSLTPADVVARALVALSRQPEAVNRSYHLLNPHPTPLWDGSSKRRGRGAGRSTPSPGRRGATRRWRRGTLARRSRPCSTASWPWT